MCKFSARPHMHDAVRGCRTLGRHGQVCGHLEVHDGLPWLPSANPAPTDLVRAQMCLWHTGFSAGSRDLQAVCACNCTQHFYPLFDEVTGLL